MKMSPTKVSAKSVCQAKTDEIFVRLPEFIEDVAPSLEQDEVGDLTYIAKLWADFCAASDFEIRGGRQSQKVSDLPDDQKQQEVQDIVLALESRVQMIEKEISDRLSEEQRAEMAAIHLLGFEVATGCGYQTMSGGGGK